MSICWTFEEMPSQKFLTKGSTKEHFNKFCRDCINRDWVNPCDACSASGVENQTKVLLTARNTMWRNKNFHGNQCKPFMNFQRFFYVKSPENNFELHRSKGSWYQKVLILLILASGWLLFQTLTSNISETRLSLKWHLMEHRNKWKLNKCRCIHFD